MLPQQTKVIINFRLSLIKGNYQFQVIARIVDGSKFDEFKAFYGDTLITGGCFSINIFLHLNFNNDFLLALFWLFSFAFKVSHGYLVILWELLAIMACCFQNLQRR